MNRFAIFDLDDTLVDSSGAVDRWFIELTEQRNLGAAGLEFLRAEQQRPVSPQESFQAIIDQFGFTESPDELRSIFLDRVPRLSRTFDGVLDSLRELRARGWRTALLTNGTEVDQQPKMRDGLGDLFDVVCFADDEPMRKPDPEIFRLVADRAGTGLDGAWMIGDSLEHDIAGGAAVGMSTIWVSGGRPLQDGGLIPGQVVSSVAEVFPLLHAAR
ncbi:2-haloalkanoic acid dehalogenase [Streptomyces litmocidini]|uniref:HAD family hydrolase n=1 Tax=Streptomyces litmocidini TaxID=67318 RepID=UPI00167DB5E4|nr:HAD family hydrolase [Streptomyces litmocidini]GGV02302.1 2-haloalkanoic acid dehalogenase [Streptomyces litmocidini]